MKSVISASRRTDIPAFYLDWFMQAIRNGRITVENPLYPGQSRLVSLDPRDVGWIVFWSRNYARFLKNINFFEAYDLFFHFTILAHSQFEPIRIPLKVALAQVEKLVSLYGPERIVWRYDPVMIWEKDGNNSTNFVPGEFAYLCRFMADHAIRNCYFSFVTPYRKVLTRLKKYDRSLKLLGQHSPETLDILRKMTAIAGEMNIQLFSCSNDRITGNGINRGSCISGELLNRLSGGRMVSTAKSPGRKDCGCTRATDIGSYTGHPCKYGCLYCYANPVKRD